MDYQLFSRAAQSEPRKFTDLSSPCVSLGPVVQRALTAIFQHFFEACIVLCRCDVAETPGLITNAKVNGLAGLGRSNLSIPSQLYAAGKIKQDSFSVCLGGFEGGGALLFGNDTIPPKAMVYTPMGNGSADT